MNKSDFPDIFNNSVQGLRRVIFGPQHVNVLGHRYHFDSVSSILESLEAKSAAVIGLSAAFLDASGYADFSLGAFAATAIPFTLASIFRTSIFNAFSLMPELKSKCFDKRPSQGKHGTSLKSSDLPEYANRAVRRFTGDRAFGALGWCCGISVYAYLAERGDFSQGASVMADPVILSTLGLSVLGGYYSSEAAMSHRFIQIAHGRWRECPPPGKEEKKEKTPVDMIPSAT